ncbi:MAG: hypothetical protein KGL75_12260, partial [Acidobacteriota bacterium]|nr:hypothetical protein [Acidobacteriota bacterium]
MNVAVSGERGAAQAREASDQVRGAATTPERDHRGRGRGTAFAAPHRYASDDEILGLDAPQSPASGSAARRDPEAQTGGEETGSEPANADAAANARPAGDAETDPRLAAALDAHPELRQAWQDAQSYRDAFATPEEARGATALLGDLDRMDALFFSR